MVPLDNADRWIPRLDDEARRYLSAEELGRYLSIPAGLRATQLRELLKAPIRRFTPVNEVYFRARWAQTLRMLHPAADLALLEVATGDADMIPQAMARTHPGGRYVTVNMNRALNRSLLARTTGLDVRLELVEEDAAGMDRRFAPRTFDVVAFQHGVNDVVQAILCDREGIDTTHADWMEILPRMIRMIRHAVEAGTLEASVRDPFLGLLRSALWVLKRGGVIAANHYMFQLDLDWGYPPELWAGYVPLVRRWVRDLEGVVEITPEGYDPAWWLFLRKR